MRLLFRTYPTHHQKIMVTTTNFIFPETLEISSSAIQKMVVALDAHKFSKDLLRKIVKRDVNELQPFFE